ncbi:hypothetical protein MMC07_004872 [Pseudocyphellaria aurata]|nr:hypothetical protein [Pseudocyphellaria aurata]
MAKLFNGSTMPALSLVNEGNVTSNINIGTPSDLSCCTPSPKSCSPASPSIGCTDANNGLATGPVPRFELNGYWNLRSCKTFLGLSLTMPACTSSIDQNGDASSPKFHPQDLVCNSCLYASHEISWSPAPSSVENVDGTALNDFIGFVFPPRHYFRRNHAQNLKHYEVLFLILVKRLEQCMTQICTNWLVTSIKIAPVDVQYVQSPATIKHYNISQLKFLLIIDVMTSVQKIVKALSDTARQEYALEAFHVGLFIHGMSFRRRWSW